MFWHDLQKFPVATSEFTYFIKYLSVLFFFLFLTQFFSLLTGKGMEYSILVSIVEDFRVAYLGEMEKKGVNSA